MGRTTLPALIPAVLLATLTLALAACGGGSTAGPIAQSRPATTTAAPPPAAPPASTPAAAAPTPAATSPTTTAPAPATAAPSGGRSRAPGGAAAEPAPASGEASDLPSGEAAAPPAPQPATRELDERARLILTRRVSPAHYFQQGTVTGTWDGTMEVEARITSKGVLVRFTATLPGGTISGRGLAVAILDSATWPGLRGRAVVTGGTGRFAGVHGRGLAVSGRSKPDASRTHVRLRGTVLLGS